MPFAAPHDWNMTPEAARELQRELAGQVRETPLDANTVRLAAGSDISFDAQVPAPAPVYAGFVTLALPEKEIAEKVGLETVAHFPYIPGLLSFREVPPLLEAWKKLQQRPDVLIADGHGRAHPRRFGLACHLGVLLDLPTIGVAKRLFVGKHDPVPEAAGSWTELRHEGEVVGAVLRLRTGASPVYVSVGHRIDLPSALAVVLRCQGATRVPETTRQAHLFVNTLRRAAQVPSLDIE